MPVKFKFKSYTKSVTDRIVSVLNNRLDAEADTLKDELQRVLSSTGPSSPGEPPGVTQDTHKLKVPGQLMRSIRWVRRNTRTHLARAIGTPIPYGFWLEVGVRGGKRIVPKRAKVLLVPVPVQIAEAIQKRRNDDRGGGSGRLRGVIEESGRYFLLMTWVRQGRIRPRPWLRPTFLKNLGRMRASIAHRID